MQPPVFIVLEGIDGAGTTTQTARLVSALTAQGRRTQATREPSDGPVGVLLRQMLRGRVVSPSGKAPASEELALLFAADRLDHGSAELRPLLADGVSVVSDRYDYSSVAYQSAGHADLGRIAWLRDLNRFAMRPDLTVVLDVSADVARARRLARAGAREIFDDDQLQAHLAGFYAQIDQHFPTDRIVHVDGDASADAVASAVLAAVRALDQVPVVKSPVF
jgi:dTMP kinase